MIPVNRANSANYANYAISDNSTGIRSVEFELAFVDFQGLDAGLKSGWWNSKLRCRPWWSGNPASGLGQRRLDNVPLAARLNLTLERFGY